MLFSSCVHNHFDYVLFFDDLPHWAMVGWREDCRKQLSCSFEFYLYKFIGGPLHLCGMVCVVRQVNGMFVVDNLVYFTLAVKCVVRWSVFSASFWNQMALCRRVL